MGRGKGEGEEYWERRYINNGLKQYAPAYATSVTVYSSYTNNGGQAEYTFNTPLLQDAPQTTVSVSNDIVQTYNFTECPVYGGRQ